MPERERLKPTFLVIGAQKSGTTAMFEYLSAHADVRAPNKKEINYFLCSSIHARGREFYESHFPFKDEVEPHVSTFEASPNYLVSGDAAERIRAYDPRMKLLVLLRDPAKRAFSAWQMYRRIRKKKPEWFFEWVETCDSALTRARYVRRGDGFGDSFEDDLRAELAVREQGQLIEMPILRHGLYEEQLRAYREHFPAEQMLVESSERFAAETAAVLEEIEAFVGLAPHDWNAAALEHVFVGQYEKAIPEPAQRLLSDFYGERNRKLWAFLGREFAWS